MNIFKIDQLRPGALLKSELYWVSGEKLLSAGRKLDQTDLKAIQSRKQERNEEEVYGLSFEEEKALLNQEGLFFVPNRHLDVDTLKAGEQVLHGVYDCKMVVLWVIETRRITLQDIQTLARFSDEVVQAIPGTIFVWYKDELKERNDPVVKAITENLCRIQEAQTRVKAERRPIKALNEIAPKEKLREYLQRPLLQARTAEEKQQVTKHFDRSLDRLTQTLHPMSRATRLKAESVLEHRHTVEDAIQMILRDCDLAMNLLNQPSDINYLTAHAFKVNILAIEVATTMGLSKQEIMNVGLAATFQDLGMLCLPQALVNKPMPLSPSELQEVRRHPIYSVEALEKVQGLPRDVSEGISQAHERLDGSGYPAGLSGNQIHPLAKILAVINVYVAMLSARPYRQALTTYDAIFFLLHNAYYNLLDRNIVKTLLDVLSLFPIGTLVELKTGEIARVVSANEEAYTRPVVSLIYDANRKPLSTSCFIDLLHTDGAEIVRIVPPDEFPQLQMDDGF